MTRRTTHAFRRAPNGQWFVTLCPGPTGSQFNAPPSRMNQLRFGDFNGDGVTDVLAVENGRWAISESATGRGAGSIRTSATRWRISSSPTWIRTTTSTTSCGSSVGASRFAAGSRRFARRSRGGAPRTAPNLGGDGRIMCSVRRSGRGGLPGFGFAGRFGDAPGGGTLVIARIGWAISTARPKAALAPHQTGRVCSRIET